MFSSCCYIYFCIDKKHVLTLLDHKNKSAPFSSPGGGIRRESFGRDSDLASRQPPPVAPGTSEVDDMGR